jgi:hypothetical protein
MAPYVPAIIWLIGMIICGFIAKKDKTVQAD